MAKQLANNSRVQTPTPTPIQLACCPVQDRTAAAAFSGAFEWFAVVFARFFSLFLARSIVIDTSRLVYSSMHRLRSSDILVVQSSQSLVDVVFFTPVMGS
jgi:hypothetical protein